MQFNLFKPSIHSNSFFLQFDQTFRYSTYTDGKTTQLMYIYEEVVLSKGVEYTITLDIMNDAAPRLTLGSSGNHKRLEVGHSENLLGSFHRFASQPETSISLGGKNSEVGLQEKWFAGCMSHFIIDGIEIPVRGMMKTKVAMETSVDGTNGRVAPFCHGCITGNNNCPHNSTCIMDDLTNTTYTCRCPKDAKIQNTECISVMTIPTYKPEMGGVGPGSLKLSLEIIIVVAVVIIIIA